MDFLSKLFNFCFVMLNYILLFAFGIAQISVGAKYFGDYTCVNFNNMSVSNLLIVNGGTFVMLLLIFIITHLHFRNESYLEKVLYYSVKVFWTFWLLFFSVLFWQNHCSSFVNEWENIFVGSFLLTSYVVWTYSWIVVKSNLTLRFRQNNVQQIEPVIQVV